MKISKLNKGFAVGLGITAVYFLGSFFGGRAFEERRIHNNIVDNCDSLQARTGTDRNECIDAMLGMISKTDK